MYAYVIFRGQITDSVDSNLAPIISYTYLYKRRRNMKDVDETPTFQDYGVSRAKLYQLTSDGRPLPIAGFGRVLSSRSNNELLETQMCGRQ